MLFLARDIPSLSAYHFFDVDAGLCELHLTSNITEDRHGNNLMFDIVKLAPHFSLFI